MISYPIKFEPILKEKIWGGSKLKTLLNKDARTDHVGESWEISGVKGNVSRVSNGIYKGMELNKVIENFEGALVGKENFDNFGTNFPLLIKFLDAQTNLSVQVHPDDKMAKVKHQSFGKTEMWYILDSAPNAEIVLGLNDQNKDTSILSTINSDNVYSIFNTIKVEKGDSYFIPAGKIHAIGAGIMVAEIQQTSDITYRVYDWDRIDDTGKQRELHTDLAISATKLFPENGKNKYDPKSTGPCNLVDCTYFTTNIIDVTAYKKLNYRRLDSFVILMCVEGNMTVSVNGYNEPLSLGETVLIPANSNEVICHGSHAKILEVFIRPQASAFRQFAA
ncbi:MAG: class I mannose-6-phosphate isomerase [Bacteroidetes bacterium]|nr:class I mannose-6-phosphate isomerase [Bacteroidota bacterium]